MVLIINSTRAKKYFPNYNGINAGAFEKPSKVITKAVLNKAIETYKGTGNNTVLFTAGGRASGKSTAIHGIPEGGEMSKLSFIFDNHLKDYDSAKENIDKVLKNGYNVVVVATLRDPIDSFRSSIERQKEVGSVVPISSLTETHVGSRKALLQLFQHYKNTPKVEMFLIDNTQGAGKAKLVDNPIDKLKHSQIKNGDKLTKLANNVLDQAHKSGQVSDEVYQATQQ